MIKHKKTSTKKNSTTNAAAAVAVISVAASFNGMDSKSSLAAISAAIEI